MKGNTAKKEGWMSKAGSKLNFANGLAVCSISQEKYKLENDSVVIL